MCVCVCVCVRERERERERLYVSVCVCGHQIIKLICFSFRKFIKKHYCAKFVNI